MVSKCSKRGLEYATKMKEMGGIRFNDLHDFAISRKYKYSIELVQKFKRDEMKLKYDLQVMGGVRKPIPDN